ncbi:MAG: hypothetical protein HC896_17390 [Bacteroidales bacterium]|nr:hypothetical protein [Bacteroidales bacterium]
MNTLSFKIILFVTFLMALISLKANAQQPQEEGSKTALAFVPQYVFLRRGKVRMLKKAQSQDSG